MIYEEFLCFDGSRHQHPATKRPLHISQINYLVVGESIEGMRCDVLDQILAIIGTNTFSYTFVNLIHFRHIIRLLHLYITH